MADLVKIEGFDKLQELIKKVPHKTKRSEVLKLLRRASKPTINAARAFAPQSSKPHFRYSKGVKVAEYEPGNLKKSIGNITSKVKDNAVLYVGPRAGSKRKNDGYYGHLVEYGTKYAPAQPFMRPAYESTKGQATDQASEEIAKYIQKTIDRLSR